MQKREWAQNALGVCVFLATLVFLACTGLGSASAQQDLPTPTPAGPTPAGPQTLVPEIPTLSPVMITYPVHGLRLTGTIDITGTIALQGWTRYELAFAFADDQTDSWFVYAGGNSPLAGTALGSWKTTAISDGDYNLRLRVFLPGSFQDGFIYGLRVRNYTPDTPVPTLTFTPTATPAATATPLATLVPTFTVTFTPTTYPTPTALALNPAMLGSNAILYNLGSGALLMILLFGVFGLFLRMRAR